MGQFGVGEEYPGLRTGERSRENGGRRKLDAGEKILQGGGWMRCPKGCQTGGGRFFPRIADEQAPETFLDLSTSGFPTPQVGRRSLTITFGNKEKNIG